MKALKITSVLLVLLLALGVGLDLVGRSVAESKIAEQAQKKYGLAQPPTVDIGGFSFLTQALSGTYSEIRISAVGVPVGDVGDVTVDLRLNDVDLPLSDALSGDVSQLVAKKASATVTVPLSLVQKQIGDEVKISTVAPDSLKATTTLKVFGQSVPIEAVVQLVGTGDVVSTKVTSVEAGGIQLPQEALNAVADQLQLEFKVPAPANVLDITGISTSPTGLIITAAGTNVTIT